MKKTCFAFDLIVRITFTSMLYIISLFFLKEHHHLSLVVKAVMRHMPMPLITYSLGDGIKHHALH